MLEILSSVLDHLEVSDLLHCARVSRRMREMVYDDARWVRRLHSMGCWNEAEARARMDKAENGGALFNEGYEGLHGNSSRSNASDHHISSTGPGSSRRRDPNALIDSSRVDSLHRSSSDGFDVASLTPTSSGIALPAHVLDNDAVLEVMEHARSVRGGARGEYGRIYEALRPYYKDAFRSKHPSNAKIFRVYRDPTQQAKMLSQLMRFARSDFSQGRLQREKRLSFMVTAFEDAVAKEYEQGLAIGDVDGRMKKYAHVLVALNGGQRAIDRFITENVVLRDGSGLGNPMDCINPAHPDHIFLDEVHGFFGHLSAAFNSQISIMERVFPPPVNVIMPFLTRMCDEIISPYLDTLFNYLLEKNTDLYIKAVSAGYAECLLFTKSLRPSEAMAAQAVSVNHALDGMITDMFVSHVEIYLNEELAYFKRKSEAEVNGWERQLSQQDASIESLYMSNVNRQADKRDFLSSFKKVVMAPVNALPSAFPFGPKSSVVKSPSLNGEGLELPWGGRSQNVSRSSTPNPLGLSSNDIPSHSASPFVEPPTTELAAKAAIMKSRLEGIRSLFSLEVALNLVHMAKSSIERTVVFAQSKGKFESDARTQCETIFILLLKTLGNRHVRAGFDQAVEHLSKYNPRRGTDERDDQPGVAPLVIFLELVNVGDLIQQMLDVFYEQELVATKLIDRNDFLNTTAKEKKRFEQMLDERVAAGLNKGIEVLMAEVEHIFNTTQNVEDFNPGATGMVVNSLVDVTPTQTAVWIIDIVSAHTRMLVGSTDKTMLDVFNQEVGLRLFAAICKHLKRQRISVTGAIRLIR